MKITKEDFEKLRAAISPLDTPQERERYLLGKIPRADSVKDLDKRYRWDLLYRSGLKIGDGVGVNGDINLYAYLNDEHIDTALRSIVPPLGHATQTARSDSGGHGVQHQSKPRGPRPR